MSREMGHQDYLPRDLGLLIALNPEFARAWDALSEEQRKAELRKWQRAPVSE